MKFSPQYIKGGINILISFGFFVMLLNTLQHLNYSVILLHVAIPIATIVTNGVLTYQILYKKVKFTFSYWFALTIISSILWYVVAIITRFITTSGIMVGMIVVVGFIFYMLKKTSLRVASIVAVFTFVVVFVSFVTGFEETYCVNKGEKADQAGNTMVKASAEDVKLISGSHLSFQEGDQIGLNFREHFRCHVTFSFKDAFIESFSIK